MIANDGLLTTHLSGFPARAGLTLRVAGVGPSTTAPFPKKDVAEHNYLETARCGVARVAHGSINN